MIHVAVTLCWGRSTELWNGSAELTFQKLYSLKLEFLQKCRPTKTILASSDMDVAKMRAFKKQTVDLVVYFIVRLIICVVQAMPVKACDQLA